MSKNGFSLLEQSFNAANFMALGAEENYRRMADVVIDKICSDTSSMPFLLKAQKYLAEIPNIKQRLNTTYKIENALPKLLERLGKSNEDIQTITKQFRSLVHYILVIECNISSVEQLSKEYETSATAHPIAVDTMLYHRFIGRPDRMEEFLCYSQANYYYSRHPSDWPLEPATLAVYADLFRSSIYARPCTEFCSSLLEAERLRKQAMSSEPVPPVPVKDFPISLRNYCFDQYISTCAFDDLKVLLKDNDRLNAPDMEDAKHELLKNEVKAFKQAAENKADDNVMRMAEYFIRYLRQNMGFENPHEEVDPDSEELNIPNKSYEIDNRIKAVLKSKLCKHKADWAVIFKILVEEGFYAGTDYTAAAARINRACGKPVTTASAIRQSPILNSYSGTWKSGWADRVHNSRSANLLNHYEGIARAYTRG